MLRTPRRTLALAVIMTVMAQAGCASHPPLHWSRLPSIPDPEGFASPFAGVSGGALIVAGGANFPDRRPWEGGTKVWYDSLFVLEAQAGAWKTGFKLPRPAAYGVSVNHAGGIVCIGGGDATHHFRDVYRLRWDGQRVTTEPLPSLPKPCAFMSGALVGNIVYIAGGIETPAATTCLNTLWSIDLSANHPAWLQLAPCPGPERMLAVAGAADGSFFLFSGTQLHPGHDGKPVRTYLRDAWRYTSAQAWSRLPDLPRPAVAAPSPAPLNSGRLLVISGDDGLNTTFKPESAHPGFPRNILAFEVSTGTWSPPSDSPISRATAPTTVWNRQAIIPNGEARPAYRSPEVWAVESPHP